MDRETYFDGLSEVRRDELRRLGALIRETLQGAEPPASCSPRPGRLGSPSMS